VDTAALYHWKVAGSPVGVFVEPALLDRLREVAVRSSEEVGGLLLGHFEGENAIITDYEAIDSEHRRGPIYTLTMRDEAHLKGRLDWYQRRRSVAVVGFFRSHLRPGMFLDEGDNQVVSSYFRGPSQVVLLVRPSPDGTATGGFFFWEEGEINRKQTYLAFPMNSQEAGIESEVTRGATPQTVSQNSAKAPGVPPDEFGNATTVDQLPGARVTRTVSGGRFNWALIGGIAAVAALIGYMIGTGGHRDTFGSRPGDISFESLPPSDSPKPKVAARVSPAITAPAKPDAIADGSGATDVTKGTPAPNKSAPALNSPPSNQKASNPPDTGKPSPMPPAAQSASQPANTAAKADVEPDRAAPAVKENERHPVVAQQRPPAPVFDPEPVHRYTPAPPPVVVPPAPVVQATRPEGPAADASVYLESVETGGIRHAFGKLPLIGRNRGDELIPPQAVRSFAPKVPELLAGQISGPLPIDLRLKVDSDGRVTTISLISKEPMAEFVRLAADAAYTWQFEPARLNGKAVASEVIAHFRFRPVYH